MARPSLLFLCLHQLFSSGVSLCTYMCVSAPILRLDLVNLIHTQFTFLLLSLSASNSSQQAELGDFGKSNISLFCFIQSNFMCWRNEGKEAQFIFKSCLFPLKGATQRGSSSSEREKYLLEESCYTYRCNLGDRVERGRKRTPGRREM